MNQENARNPAPRHRKAWLLGTASALALCATMPASAQAAGDGAETYYFPGSAGPPAEAAGPFATGYTMILAAPTNAPIGPGTVALSATITDGVTGVVLPTGTSGTAAVTVNSQIATVGGNDVINTISGLPLLPLPNAADPAIDGIAVLTFATNDKVVATSLVTGGVLSADLTAASASAALVSANTVSASTTLNSASTTISGEIPVGYTSPNEGYSGIEDNATNLNIYFDVDASVIATTIQANLASGLKAGSGASVIGNTINAYITGATGVADTLAGSPAVTANTISAAYTGNTSTTALTLQAGGAPTFTGTAAVTNGQTNYQDAGPNGGAAAFSNNNTIYLQLNGGPGGSAGVTGAASVTANAISATAIGNQATGTSLSGPTGNVLTLAGGLGLDGYGDYSSASDNTWPGAGSFFYAGSGLPGTFVSADIIVDNGQGNGSAPVSAATTNSAIGIYVPKVTGGSAALSNNALSAQAIGNEAYNAILAPGLGADASGASIAGALAITNQQVNEASPIAATVGDAGNYISSGGVTGGTLASTGNAVTASATGNSVANELSLNATSLISLQDTQANFFADRNNATYGTVTYGADFEAYGDAALISLQTNDVASPVSALVQNPGLGIQVGLGTAVANSTITLADGTAAALAQGNAAASAIMLNASTISMAAGLLNGQSSYGTVTAALVDPATYITVVSPIEIAGMAVSLNGNLERAIAGGNLATSTLNATASFISVADDLGPASQFNYTSGATYPFTDGNSDIWAGFAAYNDQATTANVAASVAATAPSLLVISGSGFATSAVANSGNAIAAAARGNEATTEVTLTPNGSLTLYLSGPPPLVYSPFAVTASAQTLSDGTNVTAGITQTTGVGTPPPMIETSVTADGVSGSALSMAANQIESLVEGNNATNGLTLSGLGTVTEPGSSQPVGLVVPMLNTDDPPILTMLADAAFTVHNMQYAGTGAVSATQNGTGVGINVVGPVASSTLQVGGADMTAANIVLASATANTASNTLALTAGDLSASGGLLNFQVSHGATSASLGEAGTLPSTGTTTMFDAVFSTLTATGGVAPLNVTPVDLGVWDVTSGVLKTTDAASLAYGWVAGTGAAAGYYYMAVSGYTYDGLEPVYGTSVTITDTTPATPGGPGTPGFLITLNGNVTAATLSIMQNQVSAASTSNSATNTVTSTTPLSSSSLSYVYAGVPPPFTGPGAFFDATSGAIVLADLGLLNNQTLGAAGSSTATANGSFYITNAAAAPTYSGSVLSVSNNTQQALAEGNTATNTLALSPGITTADGTSQTASLLSVQSVTSTAATPVSASSDMIVSAPMALTGSTLTLSGNSNTASGVANDATNSVTITGIGSLTGLSSGSPAESQATLTTGAVQSYADYSLVNSQSVATGAVTGSATTTILNNDLYAEPSGISNTVVTIDGNSTIAQAIANRASNTLDVTAAGTLGANAAVANIQTNGASVGATATIDVVAALGQTPSAPDPSTSTGSTFAITNNATQALATGNQATNILNATGSAYGTAVNPANSNNAGSVQSFATFSVLNAQANTGAVSAVANGTSPALLVNGYSGFSDAGNGGYILALNTTSGAGNVGNVSGNTVTSQAIGNRANNAITLAALNTGGATTSVTSVQYNSGEITASVSGVSTGIASVNGLSSARVANNQLAASAFGNVVTNTIITH